MEKHTNTYVLSIKFRIINLKYFKHKSLGTGLCYESDPIEDRVHLACFPTSIGIPFKSTDFYLFTFWRQFWLFCVCFFRCIRCSWIWTWILSPDFPYPLEFFSYNNELQVWLLWPGSRSTRTGWWSPPTSSTARARTRLSRRKSSPRLASGCACCPLFRTSYWPCGLPEPDCTVFTFFGKSVLRYIGTVGGHWYLFIFFLSCLQDSHHFEKLDTASASPDDAFSVLV